MLKEEYVSQTIIIDRTKKIIKIDTWCKEEASKIGSIIPEFDEQTIILYGRKYKGAFSSIHMFYKIIFLTRSYLC